MKRHYTVVHQADCVVVRVIDPRNSYDDRIEQVPNVGVAGIWILSHHTGDAALVVAHATDFTAAFLAELSQRADCTSTTLRADHIQQWLDGRTLRSSAERSAS